MPGQDLYRQFCSDIPNLPVFAQPWFLDAVCEGGEWGAAVVRQGTQWAAAMPYFLKSKGPFRYLTMPHFCKHLGPCLHPDFRELKHEHKFYGQLIDQLPAVHAIKQEFHPSVTNWLPFYWQGYRQTTRYTYQLDLSAGLDSVCAGFNRNVRRNIKKAGKELNIRQDMAPEDFFRINQLSFSRQGLPAPYSRDLFLRHDAALAEHRARHIFFAEDARGRIHSAAYLIRDGQAGYYHLSGDDPELRGSGAGLLLAWEAIRYTQEALQLPTFDFEGSMMPNVEAIRRQFGARQVPYFRVWKYHSKVFWLLDSVLNGFE